jgi:PKD repeat protein
MKNTWNKAALLLVASPLLFTACKKNDKGELSGPVPMASFTTSAPKTVGLTSQVTFTSTSTDGFLYEWDFGDGTTGTGQTVTHTYQAGGTVKTSLIVSGRGGTGTATQNVVLPPVSDAVKLLLTGGSSKTWVLNDTIAVITVGPSDSDVTSYYSGNKQTNQSPGCQADDEYTFSNANVLTYDAKGQTYVAEAAATATTPLVPAHCDTPRNYSTSYTFGPATGTGFAQLDLQSTATGTARPFIAVTDAPDLTYRITKISANRMTIRAGKSTSNVVFEIKLKAK